MNSIIETLNHSGETVLDFAWPIAWQSSLLVAALLVFDFLSRRRVRASVRYAVWLVVLVKLILPPTLALPTSPAWWLLRQPPVIQIKPQIQNYTVSYDDESLPPAPLNSLPAYVPPQPVMTWAAWLLVLSAAISTGLLVWLLLRWWQITRRVSRAETSERLTIIATQTRLLAGVRACPPVKLTANAMSPAVCGLFRPAILIPQTLAENFSDEQLRAVLLHELIHLRRRDVWLNFLQSLLQIIYWWHPLVWLANARIRRVREEAVDDAVMLALAGGAEAYAPTLLQVARLALNRPLVSLGLVGIMESRSALRQRIERLVDFRPPRRAGLTLVSLFGILAFTAVAVPMGGAPGVTEEQVLPAPAVPVPAMVTNTARYQQRLEPIIKKKQPSADDMVKSASLVADAKLDYESGELDEAEQMVKSALALNPDNAAAKYYLGLVNDARQHRQDGAQPVPGRAKFIEILNRTRLDQFVTTNRMPLEDVLSQLLRQAQQANPDMHGINLITDSITTDQAGDTNSITIGSMNLKHVTLFEVLDTITMIADEPIKYSVMDNGIVFSDNKLITRSYPMDKAGLCEALHKQTGLPIKNAADISWAARNYFSKSGVTLNLPPGKSVFYNDRLGQLYVRATESDLDIIDHAIQSLNQTAPSGQSGLQFGEPQEFSPSPETGTGILSNPNFQATLHELQKRNAVKELPEPEVVTRTGREVNRLNEISIPLASESSTESSSQTTPAAHLYLRGFKVDTQTFLGSLGLKPLPGDFGEDSPSALYPALRNFVTDLGINLESPSGKTISFNEKRGLLYVKATESDLDKIGLVLQALPPQVHIKARFLEVPKGTFAETAKMFNIPNQSNQIVGILANENFRTTLHNLEARGGVEELAEPEVVTLSGRQTQMRATKLITVITNFTFQENWTNSAVFPQTSQAETGPILDTVAYVLSDGHTINLTALASVTDFLGYDQPTNTKAAFTSSGERVDLPVILPSFRIQQANINLNMWDNQTVVLEIPQKHYYVGGEEVYAEPAYFARQRKKQANVPPFETDKELIVLVTVTLVDPAGNRVHSDDDLPLAKTNIPPQPPQPGPSDSNVIW